MKISNKVRCQLMNLMFNKSDITDIVTKYGITRKVIDGCAEDLKAITGTDYYDEISGEDISLKKSLFKKNSWKVIDKANEILIDKLSQVGEREKRIDRILSDIESGIDIDVYDKVQMGKLVRQLESLKQNNISELARVVHIFYDKQDEEEILDDNTSLEDLLSGLEGETF